MSDEAGDNPGKPTDDVRIRPLDQRTVQQIAAGEVVERPASVVKELVENSLDAGASRVVVAVESGGIDGVRVRDDGQGMTESEVRLAVQEHTTSKIRDVDDLEGGVGTLGFRGEALHTIGAVSRTTIRTRAQDTDGAGTELRMEGGEVTEVRPTGCPTGTIVDVEDLFYNTPARRKFLKTEATEFDHVNTVVTQYALANPDVAMKLEHNGRQVFATEGRGSLEAAVLSVYGREVAESMTTVEATPEADAVDAVEGLASHPETTRSSREYLSTFVNGRYVTASVLREAVLDAYGGQLAPDRYPFAVLFLSVPSDAVDVNVHPRKMEVRFEEEREVREAVERAVGDALLEEGLIRSSAPRGRSAPDETAVRPGGDGDADETLDADADESLDADADVGGETSGERADRGLQEPASTDGHNTSTAASSGSTPEVTFDAVDDASSDPTSDRATDRPDPGATRDDTAEDTEATAGSDEPAAGTDTGSYRSTGDGDDRPSTADGADGASTADPRSVDPGRSVTGPTTQRTLEGDAVEMAPEFDQLPRMRVLGQLFDTYVVAETAGGLVLVDQHAADERVNYERLQDAVAGDTTTQALADPVELELTAREAALFEEYADALAQVGFHAGRTGERTVAVRTVPAVFDETLEPSLLRDVLTAFVTGEDEDGQSTVDAVADSLLADLACYPSITGNTSLTEGSVVDLLGALDDCRNPYACPHGRPVIIEFDRDEIEDRFERDYPGHAGRRHG
jgi:DNA mismatch repair protein MutL